MKLSNFFSTLSPLSPIRLEDNEAQIVYDKLKYDALDGNVEKVKASLNQFGFDNIFFTNQHLMLEKSREKLFPLFNLINEDISSILMEKLIESKKMRYCFKKSDVSSLIFEKDNPQTFISFIKAIEKFHVKLINHPNEIINKFNQFLIDLIKPVEILSHIFKYNCPQICNLVLESEEFKKSLNVEEIKELFFKETKIYLSDGAKKSTFYDREETKINMMVQFLTLCPELKPLLNVGIVKAINEILKDTDISYVCHSYQYAHNYFHPLIRHGVLSLDESLVYKNQTNSFKILFDLGEKQIAKLEKEVFEQSLKQPTNTNKKFKL